MNDFTGTIIGQSLSDQNILKKVKIIKTDIEPVTPEHRTPWLTQWTIHSIEIDEITAKEIAHELSHTLEKEHNWYTDFKNNDTHYIIFTEKIFSIDRRHPEQYQNAVKYGLSLGIPQYQLDFSPDITEWSRNNQK